MNANDPLYPAWCKVREALQSDTRYLGLQHPKTTGDLADIVVAALRAELTNDTTEMTRRLHVGAAEAGWNSTLLAFARMALDAGYPCALRELDKPQSRDGWALTHALLIGLPWPSAQVSWRLTFEQAKEMMYIGVPVGGAIDDLPVWDRHDRIVKYFRLEQFAKRDRRK